MPVQRTLPTIKPPVKSERTHEENQERAYIAASRRGDRSIEARVESARRASEIHKRRTGRGLKVTEQDVINEEMYEEEDDDIPGQYRRLTAHLQTGSPDFNRRLAAYLSNHVAQREALNNAMNPSFRPQQFFNTQFNPQQQPLSPNSPTSGQTNFMTQSPTTFTPQSPHQFRSAPYPPSKSSPKQRTASMVVPPSATPTIKQEPSEQDRRMSTSVLEAKSPAGQGSDALTGFNQQFQLASPVDRKGKSGSNLKTEHDVSMNQVSNDYGPFSMTLPMNAQQMLYGSTAMDPNHPFTNALMGGSEHIGYPFNAMQTMPGGNSTSSFGDITNNDGKPMTIGDALGFNEPGSDMMDSAFNYNDFNIDIGGHDFGQTNFDIDHSFSFSTNNESLKQEDNENFDAAAAFDLYMQDPNENGGTT